MAVPLASALRPGIAVNIVLKADQRSGKLTTGRIADILTRGNHPRGIKVRLQDGRIGRVQSLPADAGRTSPNNIPASAGLTPAGGLSDDDTVTPTMNEPGLWSSSRSTAFDGPEHASLPSASRSLEDYVKPSTSRQRGPPKQAKPVKDTPGDEKNSRDIEDPPECTDDPQQVLQAEFPNIDSALIAAILSDGQALADARKVLATLT